jgi:5-hydroxyisourate hydrolase
MGQLTTHVLDTHGGRPAAGVRIELRSCGPGATLLLSTLTQGNGRPPQPLLTGAEFRRGRYELCFAVGEYFRARGVALEEPAFLERVVVDVGIADVEQHYHVPLLMTPWSYAVYRGS